MSAFDTKENKGLIWNIMNDSGVFKGIPDVYIDQVKRDFENKIISIKSNIQQKDTLTLLNKRVLSEMMSDMAKYRTSSSSAAATAASLALAPSSYSAVPAIVTSKDVSTQRQQQFKDGFDKKKEEFTSMFGNKPPSTIDFSDKLDKPIGSEMEDMLAATIARRNNDLNIVLEKQDTTVATAAKWINADSSSNNSGSNIIKIGQKTFLDNNTIIDIDATKTPKQVRFTESPPTSIAPTSNDDTDNDSSVSTFLSILNNKNEYDTNTNNNMNMDMDTLFDAMYDKIKSTFDERLKRMEETQIEILELLREKNNSNNNANANANA